LDKFLEHWIVTMDNSNSELPGYLSFKLGFKVSVGELTEY
jgi:hypothetical protein